MGDLDELQNIKSFAPSTKEEQFHVVYWYGPATTVHIIMIYLIISITIIHFSSKREIRCVVLCGSRSCCLKEMLSI